VSLVYVGERDRLQPDLSLAPPPERCDHLVEGKIRLTSSGFLRRRLAKLAASWLRPAREKRSRHSMTESPCPPAGG
jgi:hypothetical protein